MTKTISFKQISPHSKMRNRLDAKGKRLIKTRCNQLSMRSMELWIVAHFNKLIKSNWTRTSLRFNHLSSNAPSFYPELAMRVRVDRCAWPGIPGHASPATKAGCPIQARFWLEWDTTALDAPFLYLGAKPREHIPLLRGGLPRPDLGDPERSLEADLSLF